MKSVWSDETGRIINKFKQKKIKNNNNIWKKIKEKEVIAQTYFVFYWWTLCRQCTSYWYYVIGTSPRSTRSKLRFLSFCDQNPWKDVKSSIVFFEFVSMDDLTFRQKEKKIRVTGTLSYIPQSDKRNQSLKEIATVYEAHRSWFSLKWWSHVLPSKQQKINNK